MGKTSLSNSKTSTESDPNSQLANQSENLSHLLPNIIKRIGLLPTVTKKPNPKSLKRKIVKFLDDYVFDESPFKNIKPLFQEKKYQIKPSKPNHRPPPISSLLGHPIPHELLSKEIMSRLFLSDINNLRLVSKAFKKCIDEESNEFWELQFKCHFPQYYEQHATADWYMNLQLMDQYVLSHVDDNTEKNSYRRALTYAKENNINALKKLVLSYKDLYILDKVRDREGNSPIQWLCKNERTIITDYFYELLKSQFLNEKKILDLNKKIKYKDDEVNIEGTITECLTQLGMFDKLMYLIQLYNVDVEKAFDTSNTKLIHIAAEKGHLETVKCLVEHKANIESQSVNQTPLYWATKNKHFEVVQYLIAQGASLNIPGGSSTLLSVAIESKHHEMTRFFVAKGADMPNTISYDHFTPLEYVNHKNQNEFMPCLIEGYAQLSYSNAGDDLEDNDLSKCSFLILPLNKDSVKLQLDRRFKQFEKHPSKLPEIRQAIIRQLASLSPSLGDSLGSIVIAACGHRLFQPSHGLSSGFGFFAPIFSSEQRQLFELLSFNAYPTQTGNQITK